MRYVILVGVVLLGACSSKEPESPPPPNVATAHPLKRDVVDWDDYVGRFEAMQDVEIRPQISGTVQAVLFREGLAVRQGQPLFVIDARPYRAALAQAQAQSARAQAQLANARTELARADKLLAAEAISREEYESKLAQLRSSQADAAAARASVDARALDLSFTTIRSPISGRVSDKRASIGTYVASGQTVLTRVVSINPIRFSFNGAETFYLKYIRQAQAGDRPSSRYAPNPIEIRLADEPSYRWRGRMNFVDNLIDPRSGTIRAHALVANPDGFLIPGMFGRARLLGSGSYPALLVPDEAVVTDQTRQSVFVLDRENKTVPRVVETGPMVEGLRVIKSGLVATDRVVLDGLTRMRAGTKVNPHQVRIAPRAAADAPVAASITAPPAAEAKAD